VVGGGRLDPGFVLGVLRVLLQTAEQHRDQGLDGAVDFAFVDASLLAICCVGISEYSSSRPAMTLHLRCWDESRP
jgi:hypothetical protein